MLKAVAVQSIVIPDQSREGHEFCAMEEPGRGEEAFGEVEDVLRDGGLRIRWVGGEDVIDSVLLPILGGRYGP